MCLKLHTADYVELKSINIAKYRILDYILNWCWKCEHTKKSHHFNVIRSPNIICTSIYIEKVRLPLTGLHVKLESQFSIDGFYFSAQKPSINKRVLLIFISSFRFVLLFKIFWANNSLLLTIALHINIHKIIRG